MEFKGKKVAVIGLGISNTPLVEYLVTHGAEIIACDKKSKEALGETYEKLRHLAVKLVLGEDYLKYLSGCDYLFVTPGIPKDLPEIVEAKASGAVVTSEMNLFFHLCPAPIVGITGSNGKTTTTTLVGKILQEDGRKVLVGGNIGRPLLPQLPEISTDTLVVLELSSFQLETMEKSPHIGAILNVSPNHLDHHRSMQEYIEAKQHIYRYQRPEDFAVFNLDNPITREMAKTHGGQVFTFSISDEEPEHGVFVRDGKVVIKDCERLQEVCRTDEIKLIGQHNLQNVCAAVAMTYLCGAKVEAMREVVTSFEGIEHRIELVRKIKGVKYYNDSKATTPESTMTALKSFDAPIWLIAGGYDKHVSFDNLAGVIVERVKGLILIGATANQIENAVRQAMEKAAKTLEIKHCASLAEAVQFGFTQAQPGEIVLLSPACASYDMFKSFEDRGKQFKQLVDKLA